MAKTSRRRERVHKALAEATRHPLILGLFLPHQQGAWSPSKAPRGTDWSFDYNAQLARRADELGFDLVFALAQWLGKDGYGGEIKFRENTLDPFITSAGLAPMTKRVLLIATVHILYGWHPLHLAKYGAVIDHMSGGRWGLNVVTGYKESEFRMFGLPPVAHDERYAMADEFTTVMRRLWAEEKPLDFEGRWWRTEGAYVAPKPVDRRIVLVNAGSSPAGIDYAARHSDLIFVTSPAGAKAEAALESLPAHTARVREAARLRGATSKSSSIPTSSAATPSARRGRSTAGSWMAPTGSPSTTSSGPSARATRPPGAGTRNRPGRSAATCTWWARPSRSSTGSSA